MDEKEALKNILISENVAEKIRENLQTVLAIIPELSCMIGFEHRHPHHHLDVWEHTMYALSLSQNDFTVRLALLLHDIGKPYSFQDDEVRHFKGHAEKSAQIAKDILQRLGYDEKYVGYLTALICRHDIPLTKEEVCLDKELARTVFEIQKCDALAHHPDKNKKRMEYIERVKGWLDE